MVEVVATNEFVGWYDSLSEHDMEAVTYSVELLRDKGVSLRFPHSSAIEGSKAALRELRVQSEGSPLRVFYAFDPRRQAVLLIGGTKKGDDRFYEAFIPKAEAIWGQYLAEQAAGLHDEEEEP